MIKSDRVFRFRNDFVKLAIPDKKLPFYRPEINSQSEIQVASVTEKLLERAHLI